MLIVGSILFFIAAFQPVSAVFAEPDPAAKLDIIERQRTAWSVAQVFFGLGALVTVVGLGLFVLHVQDRASAWLGWAAVLGMLVGAALWSWHVYLRAVDPAGFVQGTLAVWPFVAYTLLTLAGLMMLSLVLYQAGYARWLVGLIGVGAILLLIAYLVFKDMPPFAYYVLTLVAGIVMVL